jgi:hypothetical protein
MNNAPPDDADERALLGCLISEPQAAIAQIGPELDPSLFGSYPCQVILRHALALLERGAPLNLLTVTGSLRDSGDLERVGGAYELSRLETHFKATPSALGHHLENVREQAAKRRASGVADRLSALCRDRIATPGALLEEIDRGRQSIEEALGTNGAGTISFDSALINAAALDALRIAPRAPLLGRWFCEGDLGFLYAQRGVGKTWLALLLSRAVGGGEAAGPWRGEARRRVLYIDGEMPAELLQARVRGLGLSGADIEFLNHELLFEQRGQQVLNLSDKPAQAALTRLCLEGGFKMLVLDNLSCLFRGISENDADAWEMVLPWLLELRRHRVAVLIVAHAGRNNAMRGTSRREDHAFWTLRLDNAFEAATPKNGAKFISSFTKPSRNTPENLPPLEWTITTEAASGRSLVAYREAEGEEAMLGWVRNGLTACSEIAEEMGLTKGTVSKLATRLIEAGRLKKQGRGYALPEAGDEAENGEA